MANNKYFYRVVVWFGHNGGVYGEKHTNIKDCKAELQSFVDKYIEDNTVVFIGVKKFDAKTGQEFVCPQAKQ